MNTYELTVILRPSDANDGAREKVREILEKNKATIVSEDPWGVRALAYPIKRQNEGYYDFMIIEAAPDSIQSIISSFRLNASILRHLFVKTQKKSA